LDHPISLDLRLAVGIHQQIPGLFSVSQTIYTWPKEPWELLSIIGWALLTSAEKFFPYFDSPMSTQVTITLPDEVYQQAERFAHLANRDVASVLADSILLSIPAIREESFMLAPISSLENEEVIALTQLQLEPDQDQKLSLLLDRQQEATLNSSEQMELATLMQIYQEGLLREAIALSEAVKRGLIEPLSK
jgi:hypothetical protein